MKDPINKYLKLKKDKKVYNTNVFMSILTISSGFVIPIFIFAFSIINLFDSILLTDIIRGIVYSMSFLVSALIIGTFYNMISEGEQIYNKARTKLKKIDKELNKLKLKE